MFGWVRLQWRNGIKNMLIFMLIVSMKCWKDKSKVSILAFVPIS